MQKKTTTIEIFGERYALKSDADEEHLRQIASLINAEMQEAVRETRSFSNQRVWLLTTLRLADAYVKLKQDYDGLLTLLSDDRNT